MPASRPRVPRYGKPYYTGKYEDFRKQAAGVIKTQWKKKPLVGPISVECEFVVSKARTSKLEYPNGDLDNYCKAIWDSCNGIVWEDDKQIVECPYVVKRFVKQDEEPHITMLIRNIE